MKRKFKKRKLRSPNVIITSPRLVSGEQPTQNKGRHSATPNKLQIKIKGSLTLSIFQQEKLIYLFRLSRILLKKIWTNISRYLLFLKTHQYPHLQTPSTSDFGGTRTFCSQQEDTPIRHVMSVIKSITHLLWLCVCMNCLKIFMRIITRVQERKDKEGDEREHTDMFVVFTYEANNLKQPQQNNVWQNVGSRRTGIPCHSICPPCFPHKHSERLGVARVNV